MFTLDWRYFRLFWNSTCCSVYTEYWQQLLFDKQLLRVHVLQPLSLHCDVNTRS